DDAAREVAWLLRRGEALGRADDVGEVVPGVALHERALDAAADVLRPKERSRRVADARPQRETPRQTAVRRRRQRDGEVGHEARAVGAANPPERHETVVCDRREL